MKKKTNKSSKLREVICYRCNSIFMNHLSPSELKKPHFCSLECYKLHCRDRQLAKGYDTVCSNPLCKRPFHTKPSESAKWCSRKCYAQSQKGKLMKCEFKAYSEANPGWKGDKVTRGPLHRWVEKRKIKPLVCERCKINPPRDLANKSGKYKRDIKDYLWLCRSCHNTIDGKIYNIRKMRK